MDDGLIPRRYAKALYKVASEKNLQQRMYTLMTNLAGSFSSAPGLTEVIDNPCQKASDKLMLLKTAAGATADDSLYDDFLHLLVKNNRLALVHAMALAYCSLYRTENNIRVVTLTTAAPLPAAQMTRLKEFIERQLKGGNDGFPLVGGSVAHRWLCGYHRQRASRRLDQ